MIIIIWFEHDDSNSWIRLYEHESNYRLIFLENGEQHYNLDDNEFILLLVILPSGSWLFNLWSTMIYLVGYNDLTSSTMIYPLEYNDLSSGVRLFNLWSTEIYL